MRRWPTRRRHSFLSVRSHRHRPVKLLLRLLLFLAGLVLLLGLAAFDPWAQTQVARVWLKQQPGVRGSIGAVSAGFSQVEVTDLRLQFGRGLLSVPTLTVATPLRSMLWDRPLPVRHLVA